MNAHDYGLRSGSFLRSLKKHIHWQIIVNVRKSNSDVVIATEFNAMVHGPMAVFQQS